MIFHDRLSAQIVAFVTFCEKDQKMGTFYADAEILDISKRGTHLVKFKGKISKTRIRVLPT